MSRRIFTPDEARLRKKIQALRSWRKRYHENPEFRAKAVEAMRQWRIKHPERAKEIQDRYNRKVGNLAKAETVKRRAWACPWKVGH